MSKLKVDGELGVRQSVYEMTTVERALSIVLENADALPATRGSIARSCQETDTIILQLLLALPAASAMSASVSRSGRQLTVTVYSDFA